MPPKSLALIALPYFLSLTLQDQRHTPVSTCLELCFENLCQFVSCYFWTEGLHFWVRNISDSSDINDSGDSINSSDSDKNLMEKENCNNWNIFE